MTNYSKFSDAEIAEAVCKRLGWGGLVSGRDVIVWIIETLNLPDVCYDHFTLDFGESNDGELMRVACFDWPAPIMMQKVKEDLIGRGFWLNPLYADGEWAWQCSGPTKQNPQVVHVTSDRETRALYEAYLEATE